MSNTIIKLTPRLVLCGMVFFSFVAVSQTESAQKAKQTVSVTIKGRDISVVFEISNIAEKLKKFIISDLQQTLSHAATPLKWNTYGRQKKIGGMKVTHKLGNDWEKEWFPEILKHELWAVVTVHGKQHLLITSKLVDSYREKWKLKKDNPTMLDDLKKFIGLLNNKEKMLELANKPREAEIDLYFFQIPPFEERNPELYEQFSEFSSENVRFYTPSLLTLQSFEDWYSEWYGKELKKEHSTSELKDAYVALSPVLGSDFEFRWPLVYVKGQWHLLQMKWM